METLLRAADAMVDGARLEGRFGYVRAIRRQLRPSWRFKLAQWVHRRLRLDQPLMYAMMERFERLLIQHLVSLALTRFMRRRIEPTLGMRVADNRLRGAWSGGRSCCRTPSRPCGCTISATPRRWESRMLRQVAIRLEGEEYDILAEREPDQRGAASRSSAAMPSTAGAGSTAGSSSTSRAASRRASRACRRCAGCPTRSCTTWR